MKWEAAAKLVAGPVGSILTLTRRKMKATLASGFAHATFGSPPSLLYHPQGCGYMAIGNRKSKKRGGEDRNRTYLASCMATTVLKTARATRHPSLSKLRKTPN